VKYGMDFEMLIRLVVGGDLVVVYDYNYQSCI
jgi:hypothetical protein